jgi:hypothetical protein
MSKEEKKSILSKFLSINSKPTKETFPELPNVLVWFRFVLAVIYGTYLGVVAPQRSSGANLLFGFNWIVFVPSIYCTTFLGAEQASYDNKILFSGVLSTSALMLLIWTYLYTSENEVDVQAMASILANSLIGESPIIGSDGGLAGEVPPMTREAEF